MAGEPCGKGAQAPQALIGVLSGHGEAGIDHGLAQGMLQRRVVDADRSQEDVGMAADIFGERLGRQVDPVLQGPEGQARRPGVVHQGQDAPRPGQAGQLRHVRHLEGLRGRALDQDQPGFGRAKRQDRVRRCIRGIVDGADPETPQLAVAEAPHRLIDPVGDQDHVPGRQHRHQRACEGGQARAVQLAEPGVLQLAHGLGQGHLRGQALAPVVGTAGIEQGRGIGQKDGGGLLDRGTHGLRRQAGTRSGGGMDNPRLAALLRMIGIAGIGHGQAPVTTGVSSRPPHSVQDPS